MVLAEIAYYAVPVGVILALAVARSPHWREWVQPDARARTRQRAPCHGSGPMSAHLASIRTQRRVPLTGRSLRYLLHYALPMETGLRHAKRRRMDHAAPHAVEVPR